MNTRQGLSHRGLSRQGLSLIEVLISIAVLGVVMAAVIQIFTSTMRVSADVNAQNTILHEGQIALQLVTARLNEALYIVPSGTTLNLSSSDTATNTLSGTPSQSWTVGTDPILALVLPPEDGDSSVVCSPTSVATACPRFFAYYPIKRSAYLTSSLPSSLKPDPNAANDASTWMLMEYRGTFDAPLPAQMTPADLTSNFAQVQGNAGQLVVDYVQPEASAPAYTLFSLDTADRSVTFRLRMLQAVRSKDKRVAQFGSSPLEVKVYPRNWN